MRAIKMLVAALALQAAIVASAQPVPLLHPTNSTWRYLADGSDQGTAWSATVFDDSLWPQGVGLFGNDGAVYAPLGFNTAIPGPAAGGPITVYFRTHFTWSGTTIGVVLSGTNYIDDGNVIYLNGVEISRFNMPEGVPLFTTTAPVANPGGFPNTSGGEPVRVIMQIPLDALTNGNANPLVTGDNVLAVEAHNQGTGSSDTVFGMELRGQQAIAPCTDGIEPTDRVITERRNTTFVVVEGPNCGVPSPSIQWYRNVGLGEEIIVGATGASYTLNNAVAGDDGDSGLYYARLTNPSGVVDSRQATLTVIDDITAPVFLSASVVGPGFNTFRLTVNEQLCADANVCNSDFTFQFNWQVNQSDNLAIDLGVASITMITPTIYEFVTSNPRDPTKQYQITVTPIFGDIGDLDGNKVDPGTFAETGIALSFQQGDANGYNGTQDTELHSNATADTVQGAAAAITIDNDDAGIAHGLLRFDNLFGAGPTQIPLGSEIVSATLTLNQTDQGSAANFHRMLVTWDQTVATWNSMVGGISADGVEAVAASDALSTAEPFPNGPMLIDVTASLRAWAGGQANHGWGIISTGTGGWDWNTSESAGTAPLLTVEYRVVPCTGLPAITMQPPATVSVNEAQTFSITVGLSNACELQWTKDGADISGANGPTYTVASAVAGPGGSSGSYRLRVTNPAGSVTSDASVVTVVPDATPPTVVSVSGGADPTSIVITFSEAVTAATAENIANYSITPSLAINGAVLSANGTTVTLSTAARTAGTRYVVTIRNIRDIRFNQNLLSPNPTSLPLTYEIRLLAFTDVWKYEQSGTDLGDAWRANGYDDSAWPSGPGVLGFETTAGTLTFLRSIAPPDGTNTVLSLTNAAGVTNVTEYFRASFNNPFADLFGITIVLRAYIDDGAVWYLNGTEAGRFNISNAPTAYATLADVASPEAVLVTRTLTGLVPGQNRIAAEVHQNAAIGSSDIAWGAEISATIGGSVLGIVDNGNGTVTLRWVGPGTLQEAPTVTGPWTNSSSQTNPQTRATGGTAQFYRLQFSPP